MKTLILAVLLIIKGPEGEVTVNQYRTTAECWSEISRIQTAPDSVPECRIILARTDLPPTGDKIGDSVWPSSIFVWKSAEKCGFV